MVKLRVRKGISARAKVGFSILVESGEFWIGRGHGVLFATGQQFND